MVLDSDGTGCGGWGGFLTRHVAQGGVGQEAVCRTGAVTFEVMAAGERNSSDW
jgi:hypothetical protein